MGIGEVKSRDKFVFQLLLSIVFGTDPFSLRTFIRGKKCIKTSAGHADGEIASQWPCRT